MAARPGRLRQPGRRRTPHPWGRPLRLEREGYRV